MAINIPIITDFDGKGIARARKEFQQLEGAGAKAGFVLQKAMVPATAALGALAVGAKDAIAAASDLEESQSKVNVIFGEGAKEVSAFAKTAAKSFGISRREALLAAGTLGTFGKAAGLAGKDLAGFTNDFTGLAADLASFNNTSPEDAIQAIGAALRGEAEPIRRYGVLLDDATLKQRALEMGIYDGVGALTAQERILAATEEIFKQTGDAQGDFARTSDGLANSAKTVEAQMDDLKTAIGEQLLPVVQEILPYLKDFADWAAENPETFKNAALAIGAIATATLAVNAAMAVNPYVLLAAGILAVMVAADKALQPLERMNNVVGSVARFLGRGFLGDIGNLFGTNDKSRERSGSSGGLGFNFFDQIPGLASGGVVTRPGLFMLAEGGESEAVIPLSKLGNMGAGPNVTINVNGGDPNAVVDALRTYMRQNGAVPIRITTP